MIEIEHGKYKKTNRYTIQNKTEYQQVQYYTMTKNKTNNKIDIDFNIYNTKEKQISCMEIDVNKSKLPKEVYDIVIDPRTWWRGHWSTISEAITKKN